MSKENREVLVHVDHMKKYFPVRKKGVLKAVDDVSFNIYKGETLGLVGESGCGKTTCGRTVLGLYPVTEGTVEYAGKNVTNLKKNDLNWFKKRAQMIFQDPYASLDPRMTVGDIIKEGMENFGLYPKKEEREERVYELLRLVGLNKEHATRFPHEFSGGQRQRIGIARALAVDPEFIVCDEPISALDVSIQAQVVGVMYMGHIVELASSKELYANPQHPYTKALLSAIPIPNPEKEKNKVVLPLEGEVGSPINCGPGCRFASRCKYATKRCKTETPVLKEIEKEHFAACHLFD